MKLMHVFAGMLLLTAPAMAQTTSTRNILETDSIFSRLRGPQAMGPATIPFTRPTHVRAPLFVGTFQEQDHYVAYLEVQTPLGSQLQKVKAGDTVAWDQSRVLEITPDKLQLSSDAPAARIVSLGNDLQNNPISESAQPAPRPQPTRTFSTVTPRTPRRTTPLVTRPTVR